MVNNRFRLSPMATTAAASLAAVLALAACSSSGDADGATGAGDEVVTVNVGTLPIIDLAPLFLGVESGIFEAHGLSVEMTSLDGGAVVVPGVVSGDLDFGFSNSQSVLIGASSGIPLQVIASGVWSTGDREADTFTVVAVDPAIDEPADLAGRTVATNALNSLGDSVTWASVRESGADPESIEFVEMPFSSMPAALENGDIDAAWIVPPFLGQVLDIGGHVVTTPLLDLADEWEVSTYFTSEQFAAENPEVVDTFQAAMNESLQFAQDNSDEVRAILPDYLEIDEEGAQELPLPQWRPGVHQPTWERYLEITEARGLLAGPVDLADLLSYADTE